MISFNKGVLGANTCGFKSSPLRSHLALGWSQAHWIMFRSGRLEDEDRQENFGLFRSCVKIDSD